MARLNLKVPGQPAAWLAIEISAIELQPGDPDFEYTDGVKARVSFFPDQEGKEFSTEFDTKRWFFGRTYFETLAYSFARAGQFAHTYFPTSYHGSETGSAKKRALHVSMHDLHVLVEGSPKRDDEHVLVTWFVLDRQTGQFAYGRGRCAISEAERFGSELLRELEAVKEYDIDSTGEPS